MADNETVLVCVTGQINCDRLIRRGAELAHENGCPLRVLHVRTREKTMMGNPDISAALNELYRLAREAEAEMEIISSQEVEDTICAYAQKHRAAYVVLGESPSGRVPDMKARLAPRLPGAAVETVRA